MTKPTQIEVFDKFNFSVMISNGHTIKHDVYSRGEGAPVVLIQEMPGIDQATLRLADKFVEKGFKVVMPHLFGVIGKTSMAGNMMRVFCMRKEFSLFSANKSSPIVDWLKALCQKVRDDDNVPGVGVIGMCLTGNFAISLMGDDSVLASVASQPAMPLHKQDALHMSEAEVVQIKERIDATAPMKAYRFEKDSMSSDKKFQCIHDRFNDDKTRVELNVLPGKGHSVLTLDFVDEQGHPTYNALEEIFSYFEQQLK